MFEQRDQNAAEASGEHAALAPTWPAHLLISPKGSSGWRNLGGRLRARNRDEGGLEIELILPVTQPLPDGDPAAISPGDDDDR